MKTGHDDQRVAPDGKEQTIWKLPDARTAESLEYQRELQRVVRYPADESIDLSAEAAAQAGGFSFVPILRLDQLGPGSLREDDRTHLRAAPLELGPQCVPGDSFAFIVIESCEAAIEFGLLRGGKGHLLIVKAVPKRRNQ